MWDGILLYQYATICELKVMITRDFERLVCPLDEIVTILYTDSASQWHVIMRLFSTSFDLRDKLLEC